MANVFYFITLNIAVIFPSGNGLLEKKNRPVSAVNSWEQVMGVEGFLWISPNVILSRWREV